MYIQFIEWFKRKISTHLPQTRQWHAFLYLCLFIDYNKKYCKISNVSNFVSFKTRYLLQTIQIVICWQMVSRSYSYNTFKGNLVPENCEVHVRYWSRGMLYLRNPLQSKWCIFTTSVFISVKTIPCKNHTAATGDLDIVSWWKNPTTTC